MAPGSCRSIVPLRYVTIHPVPFFWGHHGLMRIFAYCQWLAVWDEFAFLHPAPDGCSSASGVFIEVSDIGVGPIVSFGVADTQVGNCSDLRGSEQLAAGGEGVQASCAPGAEDGCQRHLALGTTFRPGAPADLAADNHMAPAALGGVVVRRHVRFGHEDEEFLDVALDAPAQPALQS